jgi:cytochrome P450
VFRGAGALVFGEELPEAMGLVAAAAAALHAFHHTARAVGRSSWRAGLRRNPSSRDALGRPDLVLDPALLPTSYARRFRRAIRALDVFVAELIDRRRRKGGGEDFLSLLLLARNDQGRPLDDGRSGTRSSPCSSPGTRPTPVA